MATAKVFQSGNSQAVRLPREFRLDADEVQIYRRGDEVVLRPIPRNLNLAQAFEIIAGLPIDEIREAGDEAPQNRDGL